MTATTIEVEKVDAWDLDRLIIEAEVSVAILKMAAVGRDPK